MRPQCAPRLPRAAPLGLPVALFFALSYFLHSSQENFIAQGHASRVPGGPAFRSGPPFTYRSKPPARIRSNRNMCLGLAGNKNRKEYSFGGKPVRVPSVECYLRGEGSTTPDWRL